MRRFVAVAVITATAIGCASMASPSPEDRQQYYQASPEEVAAAIREYMFDYGIMVTDEGSGMIKGESENASVAAGAMTGGSVRSRLTFNFRTSGEGTDLRATLYTDAAGRTSEALAENYRQMFAIIGDYVDQARVEVQNP